MAKRDSAPRRYAEAAFEIADRDDTIERWRRDLDEAAAELEADADLKTVLANPALPLDQRRTVAERVFDGLSRPARNLVLVLVQRGRIEQLPRVAAEFRDAGVKLVGDERARELAGDGSIGPATEADWDTGYLDLKLAVGVVDSPADAIDHVNRHGSGHSEAIVTRSAETAEEFLAAVDAACVYVNASTRFTDGYEFGMGAEIGNSTQKLHARGPIGLRELTTFKYVVRGDGQIRN